MFFIRPHDVCAFAAQRKKDPERSNGQHKVEWGIRMGVTNCPSALQVP